MSKSNDAIRYAAQVGYLVLDDGTVQGPKGVRCTRVTSRGHLSCVLGRDICTPHGKDDALQPLEDSVEHFVGVGDALVDLSYFIAGMGLEMGLPMDRMWDEVQRANMDKFPGGVALRRPDGKVVKPEGWKPPDHAGIIRQVLAV